MLGGAKALLLIYVLSAEPPVMAQFPRSGAAPAPRSIQTRAIATPVQPWPVGMNPGVKSSTVLCEIVNCGTADPPSVTQINRSPIDPTRLAPVTPGGSVLVNGSNFNDANGNFGTLVLMIGDPRVARRKEFVLVNAQWSDRAVLATIPGSMPNTVIQGFTDQLASLQVRRSDGVWSAPVTVQFIAERVSVRATSSMVPIQVTQCSTNGDQNQCMKWADFPADTSDSWGTIFGKHNSFWGTESGVDRYALALKNGWVVWWADGGINSNGCPANSPAQGTLQGYAPGASSVMLSLVWTTSCQLRYEYQFVLQGPVGVPWQ